MGAAASQPQVGQAYTPPPQPSYTPGPQSSGVTPPYGPTPGPQPCPPCPSGLNDFERTEYNMLKANTTNVDFGGQRRDINITGTGNAIGGTDAILRQRSDRLGQQAMHVPGQCGSLPDGAPRQNITDWGYADRDRGWYDVCGRGSCNDYCRWVGDYSNPFLSCALAGDTNQHTQIAPQLILNKCANLQEVPGNYTGNQKWWLVFILLIILVLLLLFYKPRHL